MSYKDRKNKNRKSRTGRSPFPGGFDESASLSREKQKARDLRKTAWWKKKISTGICYYCHKKFSPSELTMDHKIPLARGGRSEKINIVTACKDCNNKKKYLLPTEWEVYMESLKDPGVEGE